MNANVLELREVRKPPRKAKLPAPAAVAREARKAANKANATEIKAQRVSAGLLGGVAAVLTGLSLSDLAHGIELITHASQWQSYALAVGIDIGMASTEFSALTAGPTVRTQTKWYSGAMLGGTLALSAAMNAFEFASQASSLPFEVAGVVFGIAVLAAVYARSGKLRATTWIAIGGPEFPLIPDVSNGAHSARRLTFWMLHMTLAEIKTCLRNGKYAWPGGYPLYFVTVTGDALSFEAVRNRWREIVYSHLHGLCDSWRIAGCDVNWEDPQLYCEDTGKRIESAYAD